MRIIAAVTLIFLPGTFVATVFSTGMFDWGHGDPTSSGGDGGSDGGSRMVSKYIWVYFMLTGALTAVVLAGWGLFSWVQKRRMVKQFGLDLEDQGSVFEEIETGSSLRRDTDTTLVEGEKKEAVLWRWRKEILERWTSMGRKEGDEGSIGTSEACFPTNCTR